MSKLAKKCSSGEECSGDQDICICQRDVQEALGKNYSAYDLMDYKDSCRRNGKKNGSEKNYKKFQENRIFFRI